MFLHDPPKSRARKELKVNLPARLHRNLRAIQSETGDQTPRIVVAALDLYFSKLRDMDAPAEDEELSAGRGRTTDYPSSKPQHPWERRL